MNLLVTSDAKSQVTLEYSDDKPTRIEALLFQHNMMTLMKETALCLQKNQ
jgi:S-adenosylmethionine synthetase